MKKLWCLAALWIVFSGCAKEPENPTVTAVGDREIPLSQLTDNFGMTGAPRFASAEEELQAKKEFLDGLIDELLLIKAGYAHGLDTDIEILEMVETERDKFLLDELFRVEIAEKISISEKEVRQWYEHWFTRVRARHILVDSKRVADSLRQEIINGADFSAVARAVSLDPTSRRRGGDLGRTYSWGDFVSGFQEVLFSLEVDELSQPVETEYGWHLIELTRKEERPRQPLDDIREIIEEKIRSLKQRERQLEHRDQLREQYPIEIVPETVEFLREKIAEFAKIDTVDIPDSLRREVSIDFLSELEREKPFARYLEDQVMTLGQYLEALIPRPQEQKPPLDSLRFLEDFVFQSVMYELLLDQTYKLGLNNSEKYTKRIKEFTESMMAEKMRTTVLRRGISVSETELMEYFQTHPEEFFSELRLKVREIQVETKSEADAIYQQLQQGASFTELANKHTIRRGYNRNGGNLGFIKSYRREEIFAEAAKLKVGEISKPFAAEEAWSIIKLTERIEPKPQEFKTIKSELFNRLQSARIDSVYQAYVDSLRVVTPISIDEEVLAQTVDRSLYKEESSSTEQEPDSL